MAKRSKPLSTSELKAFRSKVALLKKKGLISKTDARSAKPEWVRQGKRLDKLVDQWDDVLSGKAAAVKVSEKQLRQYRKAGFETKQGRVIIPHAATEKVSVAGKSTIKIQESQIGLKRVELPVPYHDLKQWITDSTKQANALQSLGGGRKYWAYKFKGYNSYATYDSLELLFLELVEGTASGLNLMDKAQESTRQQQNEIYQNLTLFAMPAPSDWPRRSLSRHAKTSKASRTRYKVRIRGTVFEEKRRERDNEAHRNWRANLSKAELKKYNKKGAKRAKKSRRKSKRN